MSLACRLFLYSPRRMSVLSDVFDFSDSLNDDIPVSPMSLSAVVIRKEE